MTAAEISATNAEARVRPSGAALHVYPADMRREGRIMRIAEYLRASGRYPDIELVGVGNGTLPSVETLPSGVRIRRFAVSPRIRTLPSAVFWTIWCAKVLAYFRSRPLACVNAHSASVLPLCSLLAARAGCPLVYQPHEIETKCGTPWLRTKARELSETLFVPRADRVFSVGEPSAAWYRRAYRLDRVDVVRNLPDAISDEPLPPFYFADRYGFSRDDLVFLYQGQISNSRGIELMLEAFARLPAHQHLVVLGFGPLVDTVMQAAARRQNIHFHDEVPPADLPRHAAAADVGIMMIEDTALKYRLCYPGKYCEYLTAERPVVFSDFLWLRGEAERYDCGWAAPLDPQGLADVIGKIGRAEIAKKAVGARLWAAENSWAKECAVLDEIYRGLEMEVVPLAGLEPARP